ncbi:hypothetical protein AMECASPLE_034340 [Ameca splendens]|uniref:Uncharacterized protein n=1 Tax=Ameca splendens TaxID=208324 RepID=A0ABV0Y786_9TELE
MQKTRILLQGTVSTESSQNLHSCILKAVGVAPNPNIPNYMWWAQPQASCNFQAKDFKTVHLHQSGVVGTKCRKTGDRKGGDRFNDKSKELIFNSIQKYFINSKGKLNVVVAHYEGFFKEL